MRFHICNIEPEGYRFGHFLDDFCRLMCYSLESLGHDCSMACNQIEPDRVNILFGGHMLTTHQDVDTIADACDYIAMQHEVINPNGVNLTGDRQHFEGIYLPFLRRSLAVWEGIPRNLKPLEKLNIKTAFFRGGHHPLMEEVRAKRSRDIDFLFYGSITPYRRQMLDRLAARGHHVVYTFDPRASYRNDFIGRAKVHLAPIQGPGMEHFAYGRVCYLLNNRSLVVVEQCEDQEWLESCFVSAPSDSWVDACEQMLLRPDRDAIRDEFCERFQSFPFTEQVAQLLEATFSSKSDASTLIPATGDLGYGKTPASVAQTY